jgi:integrase
MQFSKRGNKWLITISCGYDHGKQVRKSITYSPPQGLSKNEEKEAVQTFAKQFQQRIKGGADTKVYRITFKTFCDEYFFPRCVDSLSKKTYSDYKIVADNRLIPYFGNMLIHNISSLDIIMWKQNLQRMDGRDKELSQNSVGNWERTLSAILGKAFSWNFIDENPCRRVKKSSNYNPDVKALQLSDVQKLHNKLPEYPHEPAKLFVMLGLETGERIEELLGAEWHDIDFQRGTISVRRTSQYIPGKGMVEGKPKSKSSYRVIPLNKEMLAELQKYRLWQNDRFEQLGDLYEGKAGDAARLFTTETGKPVFDSTARKWLNGVLRWAEVPRITCHGLRHTFASILISNNIDARTVAALLGHSSPALVYNTYANLQEKAKLNAIDQLHKLINEDPS